MSMCSNPEHEHMSKVGTMAAARTWNWRNVRRNYLITYESCEAISKHSILENAMRRICSGSQYRSDKLRNRLSVVSLRAKTQQMDRFPRASIIRALDQHGRLFIQGFVLFLRQECEAPPACMTYTVSCIRLGNN